MASSNIDKQKKSNKDSSSMYVYKFGGIGSRTPEYYTTTATAATKKSKGWGHVLIRRSSQNSKKDTTADHHERVHEKDIKEVVVDGGGIKSTHNTLGRNYVEGRKSISHQQIPAGNNNNHKNNNNMMMMKADIGGMRRKSVHDDDDHHHHHVLENHHKPSKPHVDKILSSMSKSNDDVVFLGRKYVEGRRSVSHVENHKADGVGPRYLDMVVDHDDKESAAAVAWSRKEGGRKSVSGVEGLKSEIGLLQVRVLVTDMTAFMQIHAFRCARRTFDNSETFSAKHMAYNLKKL